MLRSVFFVLCSFLSGATPRHNGSYFCVNYALSLSLFLIVAVVVVIVVVRVKLFSLHEELLSTSWKTVGKSTFFRDYGLLNLRAFIRRVSSFVPQRFQDNRPWRRLLSGSSSIDVASLYCRSISPETVAWLNEIAIYPRSNSIVIKIKMVAIKTRSAINSDWKERSLFVLSTKN